MSSAPKSNIDSWLSHTSRPKRGVPEGLWQRCPACNATVFCKQVEQGLGLCPECDHHFYISAETRIQQLLDPDSFEEWFPDITAGDPLVFADKNKTYKDRILIEQKKTGMKDACIVGRGSGGGARMHEGIFSLMQMGKVSAALGRFHDKGGLFISVLTNPTMGGVAASFASLGDIVVAEPEALIGFAGPRVVEATIKSPLPEGFQTSEFLLEHGFVDRIISRPKLRSELARLIDYCA